MCTVPRNHARRSHSLRAIGQVVLLGLVLSGLLQFVGARLTPDHRQVCIVVRSEKNLCTARIEGGGEISVSIPADEPGDRVGLYTYHPVEFSDDGQYFRNFRISPASECGGRSARTPALTSGATALDDFSGNEGWVAEGGRGIRHVARAAGDRALMLRRKPVTGDYRLSVLLTTPLDAGVVVRARDERNGYVFVVRSEYNDAFFFQLRDGTPGPILAFIPLRELSAGAEVLRLLALIGRIGVRSCCLLLVVLLLCRFLPTLRIPRPAPSVLPARVRRFATPIVLGQIAFAVMACVWIWSLDRIPHIADETAYLFQAKTFALNRLWAPAPPVSKFFEHPHIIIHGGKWYSKYPPMWPALLSLGVRAGCHGSVNPLLGAVTSVLLFYLIRHLAGTAAGVIGWLLSLSSPFFVVMSGNLMSHMATAMFVTGLCLFIVLARERRQYRWFLLSGACLGAALCTRPYTAFLVAIPVAIYIVFHRSAFGDRKRHVLLLLAFAAAVCPFLVAYFSWNVVHGDTRGLPIGLYGQYDRNDQLGFGEDKGHGWLMTWGTWGHTPAKAVRSVRRFLDHTSNYLFGWPWTLSFCFVPLSFFLRRRRPEVLLLFSVFGVLVVGHMFYWATQHIGYGARYWFSGVPPLIALTALGVRMLMGPDTPQPGKTTRAEGLESSSLWPLLALSCLVLWNLGFYFPPAIRIGHDYGGISSELRHQVEGRDLHKAVVFVKTQGGLFNDGFFMNDPLLRGDLIFARDLGPQNAELLEHYPGFTGYRWDKKSLTPLHVRRQNRHADPSPREGVSRER